MPDKEVVKSLQQESLKILESGDSAAAIERLVGGDDASAATAALGGLMHHFYWKEKDLARAILFGRAGVQHGLTAAAKTEDPAAANALRSQAKVLCYDLASFTWNGWDEPGVEIGAVELAIGLDAAQANLRMARELNKGDLPLSRAQWMLAGHLLSAGNFEEARAAYREAAKHAQAAESEGEALLSRAFEQLIEVLAGPTAQRKQQLEATLENLRTKPDGEFFADQVVAARRVFSRGEEDRP